MKKEKNILISWLSLLFVELVGDVLHWPYWWYSQGMKKAGHFSLSTISSEYERLGLGIWIKNLMVPMFGQYDWEGRLISFFTRLIQIIIRSIVLLFWILIAFLLFLIWVFLPVYIFYQITDHLKILF